MTLDDLAKLVLDDELVGGGDGILPFFLQLREFLGITAYTLDALGVIGGVGLLYLRKGDFFFGIVGGADVVSTFKGHVLHHVGQPGLGERVLGGACVNYGEEREDRSLGPTQNQHRQSV